MALFLPAAELQLARGESFRDTALVLSRFLSALMIRTFEQSEVEEFAEHASIPVINGLTDESHPLQALADAMTLRERFGQLSGLRIAYVGDGNNVCHSLMRISARFGVDFVAATPPGYEPNPEFVAAAAEDASANGGSVAVTADPRDAARGAHAVYTDVWVSMGQDADRSRILRDLEPYRVDDSLLELADREAVAMHCLPAHVGEEITAEVLYGTRCLAWEQAENRLHTQTALMALVLRCRPAPTSARPRPTGHPTSPGRSRTALSWSKKSTRRILTCSACTTASPSRSAATWPGCPLTPSRSTGSPSKSPSRTPTTCVRRSASPCSTS